MYLIAKTKNLFDYKNPNSTTKSITSNGVTLTLKSDCFELNGTQNDNVSFECSLTGFNIPFEAGKTYILSLGNAIPNLQIGYLNGYYTGDTTKQFNLLRVQGFTNKALQSFTPTQNGYFSQIAFYSSKAFNFSGTYFIRVQIEEGSTATPYVPCGYLQMYRMKYKVSNVCQLINPFEKSTFTRNNLTAVYDGNTIHFSGTVNYTGTTIMKNYYFTGVGGHKYYYYYKRQSENQPYLEFKYIDSAGIGHWFLMNEGIYTLPTNQVYYKLSICPIFKGNSGTTIDVTWVPQLFDLTEMYGAGNEPTTVEDFRKDFPDDYYEYSPNTYLTTHSKKLITSANTSISFN